MTEGLTNKYVQPGLALAMVLACSTALPVGASSTNLLYKFDGVFSANSVAPTGSGPWITTTFANTVGGVLLTISNANLVAAEKLDVADLNLNPALNAANLSFSLQSQVGSFTAPGIGTQTDHFKADGDGYYDIQFMFDTSTGGSFMGGESVTYLLTGITGLSDTDFAYLSAPSGPNSAGPYYAAFHIQGTGNGTKSAWIEPSAGPTYYTVPEPDAGALLGLAASLGLVLRFGRLERKA